MPKSLILCVLIYMAVPKTAALNTSRITHLLDKLFENYDRGIRPSLGEGPLQVNVSMTIKAVTAVSERDLDFTVSMFFRQAWFDPRLRFDPADVEGLDRINVQARHGNDNRKPWEPDTFFPYEKSAYKHGPLVPNEGTIIHSNGKVMTSVLMTMTSICEMDFHHFPFDTQTCTIGIESYHHPISEMFYVWNNFSLSTAPPELMFVTLPFFRIIGQKMLNNQEKGTKMNFSFIKRQIVFSRTLSYYFTFVYIPQTLFVAVSWIPLWIDPDHVPERVAIGVTILLTVSSSVISLSQDFPQVTYTRLIDLFTGIALTFTLASILENVIVIYYQRKNKKLLLELEQKSEGNRPQQGVKSKGKYENMEVSLGHMWACVVSKEPLKGATDLKKALEKQKKGMITPEDVDRKARVILPPLYLIYVAMYFVYCCSVAENLNLI